ncbi:MAG TPA: 3TM-type holin [Sphingomonadaceae bacterium]|nr:3TM-type holin [Sphingomonadaceae bacterium]
MPRTDALVAPVFRLIDRLVDDPRARDEAKLRLMGQEGAAELEGIGRRLALLAAERRDADRWVSRARPTFLYVMYLLLLWSIPMGLIAAYRPDVAAAIIRGMSAYLGAIPEPLYALFGTGYLGYTMAREWGKGKR